MCVRSLMNRRPSVLMPFSLEFVDFLEERGWFENHPVADDARLVLVDDAGGDEVEDELEVADLYGVTRVRPALKAHDDSGIGREIVDDLRFSLIAPLGA